MAQKDIRETPPEAHPVAYHQYLELSWIIEPVQKTLLGVRVEAFDVGTQISPCIICHSLEAESIFGKMGNPDSANSQKDIGGRGAKFCQRKSKSLHPH